MSECHSPRHPSLFQYLHSSKTSSFTLICLAGVTGTKVFTEDGSIATITTASAVPTPAAAGMAATGIAGAPAGVAEYEGAAAGMRVIEVQCNPG